MPQTIRYSEAFDCLILERAEGRLYYYQKDNLYRLVEVLQWFAKQDREWTADEDRRVPPNVAAFLAKDWLAKQPTPPVPPGAEIEINIEDLL